MQQYSMIYNRLLKNKKKLKSFLKNNRIYAYRLFDKDIPEYPYIIDIYNEKAICYEKGKRIEKEEVELLNKAKENKKEISSALESIIGIEHKNIIFKNREVKKGLTQYEKLNKQNSNFQVQEGPLTFKVNLVDYLDTGLFLDHRPLRSKLILDSKDKKVLNLFAYTGSLSVAAAFGGASVTTVDMSKTYIEWASENFKINNIPTESHSFVQADVLTYIEELDNNYDLILLDPPSFSNSKRMNEDFDVQRDHAKLIQSLMPKLNKDGTLIFSNNNRKFKLDSYISQKFSVKDVTQSSIPLDFRDKKVHCCFEIKKASL